MQKVLFFIIIAVAVTAFAAGDYFLNIKSNITISDATSTATASVVTTTDDPVDDLNLIQMVLDSEAAGLSYEITKRNSVDQVFDLIDLSQIKNIKIYQNQLKSTESLSPITVYEIHGPAKQGDFTYLNIKLKFLKQVESPTGINETGEYGKNSFYLNNVEENPDSSYLVVEIGDNVLAFKFSKAKETADLSQ